MMYQMSMPAPRRYFALRRHSNPRCACPECTGFDHSSTQPMVRLSSTHVSGLRMIDTETSEVSYTSRARVQVTPPRQQAISSAVRSSMPKPVPATRTARPSEPSSDQAKPSFPALVHAFIIERVEKSIQKHPVLWLCVSSLLK